MRKIAGLVACCVVVEIRCSFVVCTKNKSFWNPNGNVRDFGMSADVASLNEKDIEASFIGEEKVDSVPVCAVLNITYAGCNFNGWVASNDSTDLRRNDSPVAEIQGSRRRRKSNRGTSAGKSTIRTVAKTLRKNLAKLYGNVDPSHVNVVGCSRTDKGVHAKSQIALINCTCSDGILPLPFEGDLGKMQFALNRMLPPDVRVAAVCSPPQSDFHPTLDTVSKTYRYTFSLGSIHDPLRWRYIWHLPKEEFDYRKARRATSLFLGEHNFMSFKGAFRGNDRKSNKLVDPMCTIKDAVIMQHMPHSDWEPITYTITIKGNRFLYKMVRFIVGTIVACGLNKIDLEDVQIALQNPEYAETLKSHVLCAPAHGLVLNDVDYGPSKTFQWIPALDQMNLNRD